GTPGGSTIITTVAQIVCNVIDHGMSAGEAVASPRFHHQWLPDTIFCEPGALDPAVEAGLKARGHAMKLRRPIGDAQVIEIRDGMVCGAPDPRAGGSAGVTRGIETKRPDRKER
ncbi:MAG: gamma-glutamyltransferase, partial [Candidatus Krumholzibacteria bacterium]|nr:gamma-glutamyltransferase [Candidatus Krumholzibacteria bacterium]